MRKIGQIAETLLDGLREKARRRKILSAMVDAQERKGGNGSARGREGAPARTAGGDRVERTSGTHVKKMT